MGIQKPAQFYFKPLRELFPMLSSNLFLYSEHVKIEMTNELGRFIPDHRNQKITRLNLLAFLINILIASLIKTGSCVNLIGTKLLNILIIILFCYTTLLVKNHKYLLFEESQFLYNKFFVMQKEDNKYNFSHLPCTLRPC